MPGYLGPGSARLRVPSAMTTDGRRQADDLLPHRARARPFHVGGSLPAGGGGDRRAGAQSATAHFVAAARADLSGLLVRQIRVLRAACPVDRSDLGLWRHSLARPRRLLRARRLRHGHVLDAPDRHPRRLCPSGAAGFHGVPQLAGAAGLLVRVPALPLRAHDGGAGARRAGVRVRLVRLPQPRHRRLSLHYHPGAHLRADARLLSQQFRLRRQQWPDRLQGHPRLQCAGAGHAGGPVRDLRRRAHARLSFLPHHRDVEIRESADRDPRCRGARPLPRLSRRVLQALRVHAVGLHGRHCRRALRAAGWHHQPERVLAGQFDRGSHLGRGGWPRNARRRDHRRRSGELRQDQLHHRDAGAVLAVPARRPVRRRDAAATARDRRNGSALVHVVAPARRRGASRRAGAARPASGGVTSMDMRTTSALLYLDGLTVSFDGFRALDKLSLAVEPGEMRAIIGPNGAGKTTMMDVVTGKTKPDEGDALFDGSYDLTKLDESEIAELGIGRKFQKPTVFDSHTVEDNLLLALKGDRRARRTLFGRENGETQARIDRILDTVRLGTVRGKLAGSLSHGQKQWLEIGMLLAQDPKLLLVDEPAAGMTDAETHQTAELLKDIN